MGGMGVSSDGRDGRDGMEHSNLGLYINGQVSLTLTYHSCFVPGDICLKLKPKVTILDISHMC